MLLLVSPFTFFKNNKHRGGHQKFLRFTRFSQVKLKLWEPFLCKTFNKFHIWLSMPVWPKFWVTSDHDDEFPPNWWFTHSRLHPLQVQSADPRTSLQIARAPTTIVTIQKQMSPTTIVTIVTIVNVKIQKQMSPKTQNHCHHIVNVNALFLSSPF